MKPQAEYVSIAQLSAISGLSVSTLRRRLKDGSLPFLQPGGTRSRLLFRRDVLDTLARPAGEPVSAQSTARQAVCPESVTPEASLALPGPRPRWMRPPNH